jgi:hypothetical protein
VLVFCLVGFNGKILPNKEFVFRGNTIIFATALK